jgi:hypothetical protein
MLGGERVGATVERTLCERLKGSFYLLPDHALGRRSMGEGGRERERVCVGGREGPPFRSIRLEREQGGERRRGSEGWSFFLGETPKTPLPFRYSH